MGAALAVIPAARHATPIKTIARQFRVQLPLFARKCARMTSLLFIAVAQHAHPDTSARANLYLTKKLVPFGLMTTSPDGSCATL